MNLLQPVADVVWPLGEWSVGAGPTYFVQWSWTERPMTRWERFVSWIRRGT